MKLTYSHSIECHDCGTGYSINGPLGAYQVGDITLTDDDKIVLCDECAETRENRFELSGEHDEDVFLCEDDMTEEQWELLMGCHHQGRCDDDTKAAAAVIAIKDLVAAVNYCIESGVERERFGLDIKYPERVATVEQIKDQDAVRQYYLWLLAGDIQDRMTEEKDNERKQYQRHEEEN